MASAPDLWTMLCTGMALLGAAHLRSRILTTASGDPELAPPTADQPNPELPAATERN